MGGCNRGGGMMGMELLSRDSKHPLHIHMEGGWFISVRFSYYIYGWIPPGKLSD